MRGICGKYEGFVNELATGHFVNVDDGHCLPDVDIMNKKEPTSLRRKTNNRHPAISYHTGKSASDATPRAGHQATEHELVDDRDLPERQRPPPSGGSQDPRPGCDRQQGEVTLAALAQSLHSGARSACPGSSVVWPAASVSLGERFPAARESVR